MKAYERFFYSFIYVIEWWTKSVLPILGVTHGVVWLRPFIINSKRVVCHGRVTHKNHDDHLGEIQLALSTTQYPLIFSGHVLIQWALIWFKIFFGIFFRTRRCTRTNLFVIYFVWRCPSFYIARVRDQKAWWYSPPWPKIQCCVISQLDYIIHLEHLLGQESWPLPMAVDRDTCLQIQR